MTLQEKIRAMVKHIREKTDEEIDKIYREAEEQANSIKKRFNDEAERISREIVEGARAEANQQIIREESRAELEASKMKMDARLEILEDALAGIERQALKLIGKDSYPKLLSNFVSEAIDIIQEKSVVVKAFKDDIPVLNSILKDLKKRNPGVEIVIFDKPLGAEGEGIVVESADGRLKVENSIAGKIREKKEWIAKKLFERLEREKKV